MVRIIQVLKQREWTEAELKTAHFQYYPVRKRLVMARVLRESQNIELTLEVLNAVQGDVICYTPGDQVLPSIEDYDHWPVRADLFRQNYRPWTESGWRPNPVEIFLMTQGCRPYYKTVGIWAQRLRRAVYVQSLESPRPALIPAGRWLCIGTQGEPYHMNDHEFRSRYLVSPEGAPVAQ